jgi:hypothetical protein
MGRFLMSLAVISVCLFTNITGTKADDSASTRALFANPPAEYSSAPFWVWNDTMTDELVISTLRDLAGQGIRQVFIHPRPGLTTPYLSAEWFRLWKTALGRRIRRRYSIIRNKSHHNS